MSERRLSVVTDPDDERMGLSMDMAVEFLEHVLTHTGPMDTAELDAAVTRFDEMFVTYLLVRLYLENKVTISWDTEERDLCFTTTDNEDTTP